MRLSLLKKQWVFVVVLLGAGSGLSDENNTHSVAVSPEPLSPVSEEEEPDFFSSSLSPLSDDVKQAMRGVTWHPGCPVPLEELRSLRFVHRDAKGKVKNGELIVHSSVSAQWQLILEVLFAQEFVIEKAVPIRKYHGDDDESMKDNNTSAFNCRKVTGGKGFSKHAYGLAIDVNPLWNPYVKRRGKTLKVAPKNGQNFVERTSRMGTIVDGDDVVRIFRLLGFTWGGRWRSVKDYQHFEPLRKGRPKISLESRQKAMAVWKNERSRFQNFRNKRQQRREALNLRNAL